MKIVYDNKKLEKICQELDRAKRFFGGNSALAEALFSRINALKNAESLNDIIMLSSMHFHVLKNKGKKNNRLGEYAIDIKGRKEPWRLIVQPLDENEKPNLSKHLEYIKIAKVILIKEVSQHYE